MSTGKPKSLPPGTSEVGVDKEITVAAAKAALLKEKQDRQVACIQEIDKILKKYNCELFALPMITKDGRITAQAQIGSKA
jgi:hypothetical protein